MAKDKEKKVSLEPYKGVRDFYPPEMFIQNYIFSVMKKTVESFGYVEYGASILEPAELYRSKTSDEIVNEQTYTFKDRGDREVTLRPEMTPTIARMIAAKRRELAFPLRWYSIPNAFRYERPQRGRLREHWQLNADFFGVAGIEAEAEIIFLAYKIMRTFGAKDEQFEIQINDRSELEKKVLSRLNDKNELAQAMRLLDKKDKLEQTEFGKQWSNFSDTKAEFDQTPNAKIQELLSILKKRSVVNAVFNPILVRGFDYYTGVVFEVFDKNPKNNRSLFGGGRYDNLLEMFDEEKIPAVGFGMGDVTIRDFLETYDLLPRFTPTTDLYLVTIDKNSRKQAEITADKLRVMGLNVAVDLSDKKVGDQIKTADKQSIPFIMVIGEEELKTGRYKLKNLKSREETDTDLAGIVNLIKNH